MARQESDREDLLREATALVARAEFSLPGETEPIVAGFRRDGAASFYFGADPVVQFDLTLRVRRGFYQGQLLKAERGKLVSLTRHRTETETQLIRGEWTDDQARAYLWEMRDRLAGLRQHLDAGTAQVVGAVPTVDAVVPRLREWLALLPISLEIARVAGLSS